MTSFLGSGLAGPAGRLADVDLMWAENDWLAENRWQVRALREALPDLNRGVHEHDSRGWFGFTSAGSWSSGRYLPMGAAVNRRTGHAWVWQIEHNGGWHWQVGEHTGRDASAHNGDGPTDAYLALLGPTDAEHHWRLVLRPGESFETVPVAVALSNEGFEAAMARLTDYRRAIRRPHQDHRRLPVIFNDYLNTLMGDPTTERLMPLITAAASAGAEYFCIDSGWYNEIGERMVGHGGRMEAFHDEVSQRHHRGARPNQGRGHGPRPVARTGSRRSAQSRRRAVAYRKPSSPATARAWWNRAGTTSTCHTRRL